MKHIFVFLFFATFSIGIVSLSIAANIYVKTKAKVVQYYLYFYTPFTLVVVLNALHEYIDINVPAVQPYIRVSLGYFETVAMYVLMFTIPVFAHGICSVPYAKIKNAIFGGIAIITYIGYHFCVFIANSNEVEMVGSYISFTIFISVNIYVFLIGIYHYRKLEDDIRKKLTLKVVILIGVFLPGIIYDTFPTIHSSIHFFPILYCGFSVIFTHHLIKYYSHPPQVPRDTMSQEKFFEKYDISPREREIVLLLLQGYSNNKIAETLCIALSTVKTHLRNIYPKFGVNSRYELLTLFKNNEVSPASGTEEQES